MPLRLRPDVSRAETDDGLILLNERTGAYWQLNRTGAHVLGELTAGSCQDRIAADLARRYGISRDRAAADVAGIVSRLRATRLVEES